LQWRFGILAATLKPVNHWLEVLYEKSTPGQSYPEQLAALYAYPAGPGLPDYF
jgi:hypothetical protein